MSLASGCSRLRRVFPLVLLAVLTIALTLVAAPALADGDPAGSWSIELEFQGQAFTVTLAIEKTAEGYAGTWTTPRGTDELSDVAWDGTNLSFKRHLERQGNEITIEYSATIDGDTMNGTMSAPRGERPFTGKRSS